MRHILTLVALLTPAAALAQAPAAPVAYPESEATKHDQGTVKSVDVQRGLLICDLPDGSVTYQVGSAQLLDAEGKPQGAAPGSLKAGDRVKITYEIIPSGPERGAKASVIRLMK